MIPSPPYKDFVPAFLETVALELSISAEVLLKRCAFFSNPSEVASDLGIFQELDGFHYSPRPQVAGLNPGWLLK